MISGTYYLKAEVAQILGKTEKTIYNWMKGGKVKYRKVGPLVFIEQEELKRLQAELKK